MAKVNCLIGPTGSGKTRIAKAILKSGLPVIKTLSTTSRAMRAGEVQGVDYNFVSNENAEQMKRDGIFLETREKFNKKTGKIDIYGLTKDCIDINSDNIYISVVDFSGYEKLIEYLGEENVTSFYIDCSDQERMIRCCTREQKTRCNIKDIVYRFVDDYETILNRKNECDYIMNNEDEFDFYKTVKKIIEIIEKQIP